MDIRQQKQKASYLRKQKQFDAALELYKDLWLNHRSDCNEWEGWGYATCLRKSGRVDEAIDVCREVYKIKSDFEAGNNLYAWCVYDTEIKKDIEQIKEDERIFIKAVESIFKLVKQDQYSPYTKAVFKVVEYLIEKKNIFPAEDIIEWLNKLNTDELSIEPFSFNDESGKRRELQSDKEKFYALKTKALLKAEKYQDCISLCEKALSDISKFHFNNDIWLKRRIALSKGHLGEKEQAVNGLKVLLNLKNEWFIQYEIAQLCYDLEDFDAALNHAIDSALNFGKDEFKWELFQLMAKILIAKNDIEYAKKHLILAAKLRKEREWKITDQLTDMLTEMKINLAESVSAKEMFKELSGFWKDKKYSALPKCSGKVKTILKNGKAGFITANEGKDYYFKIKSFNNTKSLLKKGLEVTFYVEKSFDPKKNIMSDAAVNIRIKQ